MLKPEFFNSVVLMVTKMDLFKLEGSWKTKDNMEQNIPNIFAEDCGVHHIDCVF